MAWPNKQKITMRHYYTVIRRAKIKQQQPQKLTTRNAFVCRTRSLLHSWWGAMMQSLWIFLHIYPQKYKIYYIWLFATPWTIACQVLCTWNSPGQNTWASSQSLLQGIFSIQGSNPGLPHCRWILYCLSHQGSPKMLMQQKYNIYPHRDLNMDVFNSFIHYSHELETAQLSTHF